MSLMSTSTSTNSDSMRDDFSFMSSLSGSPSSIDSEPIRRRKFASMLTRPGLAHEFREAARCHPKIFTLAMQDNLSQQLGFDSPTKTLSYAANNPIRQADDYLKKAEKYRHDPTKRARYFEELADAHIRGQSFSEAAVCLAHAAAIIAKELQKKEGLWIDWNLLNWVSDSIAEDERVTGSRRTRIAGFTMGEFYAMVARTAQALYMAERYEAIGPLYRLVIPSYEAEKNYQTLERVYLELQDANARATEVKVSGKRRLGEYFLVHLFGENHFGMEHDTFWVYREPGYTSLAEFCHRIRNFYVAVLEHNNIEVAPEDEVEEVSTSPSVASVRVAHLDPAPAKELTDFEMHTNLRRFTFEKTSVEGDPSESFGVSKQGMTTTVVEVKEGFPSTRRRLPVCKRIKEWHSPLVVAMSKLRVRAREVHSVLRARPLDVKRLQLVLQGTVLATVNAGPLVYAEAFTQDEQVERYGREAILDLQQAFSELVDVSKLALLEFKKAATIEQLALVDVLSASFAAMRERLQVFFGSLAFGDFCDGAGTGGRAVKLLEDIRDLR